MLCDAAEATPVAIGELSSTRHPRLTRQTAMADAMPGPASPARPAGPAPMNRRKTAFAGIDWSLDKVSRGRASARFRTAAPGGSREASPHARQVATRGCLREGRGAEASREGSRAQPGRRRARVGPRTSAVLGRAVICVPPPQPCEFIRKASLACSVKYPNDKESMCMREFENYKMCIKEAVRASRGPIAPHRARATSAPGRHSVCRVRGGNASASPRHASSSRGARCTPAAAVGRCPASPLRSRAPRFRAPRPRPRALPVPSAEEAPAKEVWPPGLGALGVCLCAGGGRVPNSLCRLAWPRHTCQIRS